jgi:hypothetical protein
MFDRNVDGVVGSLPAAVDGQAYFLTADNRLYFAVGTTWFSSPTPKWFEFVIRSSGATYQFNGASAVQFDSPVELDARLDTIEMTVASLGTAAFEDIESFATQAALDIVEASSQAYTDVLWQDLVDPTQGAGLVAFDAGEVYPAGSVGDKLKTLSALATVNVVGDGIADDWAVLQAALSTGVPHLFGGHCRVSQELVAPSSGAFLVGMPGSVIDGSEVGFTGTSVISASGSLSAIAAPSGAIAEGATSVSFGADHNLVPGDVFCLWNPDGNSWSTFRTNYFEGEWCKVEQVVSSTSVLLTSGTYSAYSAGVLEAHKLNTVPVNLTGFSVIGSASQNAVSITNGTGLIDLDVVHANNAAISVNRSYDVTVKGKTFNVGAAGDDYGVAISNSQRVRTYGRHHSRRHPVTHGGGTGAGSVPCRDSRVIGATLTNDAQSGVHCADFHGNSEDCYFIDCDISGGGTLQGKDTGFINCRITNMLAGHVIQASEVKGGKFTLANCDLITNTNPQPGGRGIVNYDAGITEKTTARVLLEVTNCRVVGTNLTSSSYFARFVFRGSVVPIDTNFNGIDFNVNALGTIYNTLYVSGTAASNGTTILNLSGNLPAGVALLSPGLTSLAGLPLRLPRLSGSEILTTSTSAAIVVGTPVVFKYSYPKKPVAGCNATERAAAGNRVPMGMANPVSTTGLTPQVLSSDGTNFSAAVTVTANWFAEFSDF